MKRWKLLEVFSAMCTTIEKLRHKFLMVGCTLMRTFQPISKSKNYLK